MNVNQLNGFQKFMLSMTDFDEELNSGNASVKDIKSYVTLGLTQIVAAAAFAAALVSDIYLYAHWGEAAAGTLYATAGFGLFLIVGLIIERSLVLSMSQSDDPAAKRKSLYLRVLMMLGSTLMVTFTLMLCIYKTELSAHLQEEYIARSLASKTKLTEATGLGDAKKELSNTAAVADAIAAKLAAGTLTPALTTQKAEAEAATAAAEAFAVSTNLRIKGLRESRILHEVGSATYERLSKSIATLQKDIKDKRLDANKLQKQFTDDKQAYMQAMYVDLNEKKTAQNAAAQTMAKAQKQFQDTSKTVDESMQAAARPGLTALGRTLFKVAKDEPSMWFVAALIFAITCALEMSAVLLKYSMKTMHQRHAAAEQAFQLRLINEKDFAADAMALAASVFWKSPEGVAVAMSNARMRETDLAMEASINATALSHEKAINTAIAAEIRILKAAHGRENANELQKGLREQLQNVIQKNRQATAAAMA